MAKAIITLTDGELDGEVLIDLDFGEGVDLSKRGTAAQHAAIEMVTNFKVSPRVTEMEMLTYGEQKQ
jgi:hypothetical protein